MNKPYKCTYCGRRFNYPTGHKCKGGFRKHHLSFVYIPTEEESKLFISQAEIFDALRPEEHDVHGITSPLDTQIGGGYNKVSRFKSICAKLAETYEAKNKDYGDSFGKSIEEYGPIAGVVRINDKFNRIKSLIKSGEKPAVKESVDDTLLDMANYCIMLYMEINPNEKE